jgi:hypothetical protein
MFSNVNIVGVIRSRVRGRAEERRELCYDQRHVWTVAVVVTIPDTLPCVLRGGWDRWTRVVPPRIVAP